MADTVHLAPLVLEDRKIVFRNFSGLEGQYNAAGDRNFNVLLTPDEAEAMIRDGWNVKFLKPREEGDEPQPRLEVSVRFNTKGQPPQVVLITSRGRNNLTEDMVGLLDWAEITHVDMIVRPYQWEVGGRTGVKAYLKSIYVTIREDPLELKYADVPDSASNSFALQQEAVDPLGAP